MKQSKDSTLSDQPATDFDEERKTFLQAAQHPDFIWTWKSSARGARASLWLPYFSRVEKRPGTRRWRISYNGGEIELDLEKIDFVMFYGASGTLPLEFLDALSQHRIPFMIHRRNQVHPYVFFPANSTDDENLLTHQILVREHAQKRIYVARTLIRHRLEKFESLIAIPEGFYRRLRQAASLPEVRQLEAQATARFWEAWFARLGVDASRRDDGPVAGALDAGSKFLYGIILRWVLFHKLSPCHGFLHEPTGYPALIYDLMEPYRYVIEDSVAAACQSVSDRDDEKKIVAASINEIKRRLDAVVYVPATRQCVRRKNLLHGVVLALRAYLLNESLRLVLPVEGEKRGGRPPKIGYRLPGETKAGKMQGRETKAAGERAEI